MRTNNSMNFWLVCDVKPVTYVTGHLEVFTFLQEMHALTVVNSVAGNLLARIGCKFA